LTQAVGPSPPLFGLRARRNGVRVCPAVCGRKTIRSSSLPPSLSSFFSLNRNVERVIRLWRKNGSKPLPFSPLPFPTLIEKFHETSAGERTLLTSLGNENSPPLSPPRAGNELQRLEVRGRIFFFSPLLPSQPTLPLIEIKCKRR